MPRSGDQLQPDPDGVLRLRFVASPPPVDNPVAALPANPTTDAITVALPISFLRLSRLSAIQIEGGDRVVTLTR